MENQVGQLSNIIAVVSIIIAILSLVISIHMLATARRSATNSERSAAAAERSATAAEASTALSERSSKAVEQSINTNIQIFKRQGVISLYAAWRDIKDVDPQKIVTADAINAARTLELTATLWNYDIVEKEIIYQSFWDDYRAFYEKFMASDTQVPGRRKTLRELIIRPVTKLSWRMGQPRASSCNASYAPELNPGEGLWQ